MERFSQFRIKKEFSVKHLRHLLEMKIWEKMDSFPFTDHISKHTFLKIHVYIEFSIQFKHSQINTSQAMFILKLIR